MMILMDPPHHTRLRALVSRSFTARRMAELQPRVQQIADDLLARLPETGAVDLMQDYAFQLPVQVICELLGVPTQDRDAFGSWTRQIMDAASEPDRLPAMGQLAGYLSELIERKHSEPDDALLSALVRVSENEADRLSAQELVGMAVVGACSAGRWDLRYALDEGSVRGHCLFGPPARASTALSTRSKSPSRSRSSGLLPWNRRSRACSQISMPSSS